MNQFERDLLHQVNAPQVIQRLADFFLSAVHSPSLLVRDNTVPQCRPFLHQSPDDILTRQLDIDILLQLIAGFEAQSRDRAAVQSAVLILAELDFCRRRQ